MLGMFKKKSKNISSVDSFYFCLKNEQTKTSRKSKKKHQHTNKRIKKKTDYN
jgi:hypothetical protein